MKKKSNELKISLKDLLEELKGLPKVQNNKPVILTEEQIIFLKETKKLRISSVQALPLWIKKWGPMTKTSLIRRIGMIDGQVRRA